MPKLKETEILAPKKTFLAIPDHYVNLTALIPYATLSKLVTSGQTVIPAGKVVNLAGDGEVKVAAAASGSGETAVAAVPGNAILFHDVDISDYTSGTDTNVTVTVMVHGFVRKDRLTSYDVTNFENDMIYVLDK